MKSILAAVLALASACAPAHQPSPAGLDRDEVAIYGLVTDSVLDTAGDPFVVMAESTFVLELRVDSLATRLDEPEPERAPLARMLTDHGLSLEPLDALLAADSPAVRVDLNRLVARTRIRVARLVYLQARGLREPPAGAASLSLSRVSFFPGRRMALVAVSVSDCNRCGKGGLLLMTRRDDGTWGISRTIRGGSA